MRVAVVGAGLVGCYLGAQLAVHGHDVVFFGRPRLTQLVLENGMSVSTSKGPSRPVERPVYHDDITQIHTGPPPECVLVTLKSVNTLEVVEHLRQLPAGTVIVSFQNGIGNAAMLRDECPNARVFAGMFPFNVVMLPPTHFHQATVAPLYVEEAEGTRAIIAALNAAEVPTLASPNMTGILHGKLLLNLNNAINALSGIPLKQELSQWGYRNLMAACISEALAVYAAAGIQPVTTTPTPIWTLPYVLRLPDFIFTIVAVSMLSIDETARSSMEDDLRHKRHTEIEFINGYVESLGTRFSVPTPTISALANLIRDADTAQAGSPQLSAAALATAVDAQRTRT